MKPGLLKHPLTIIFVLFVAGFFLVEKYSQQYLSDEPVVLTKANPPQIIMYSTQNCMYCFLAKSFFIKHDLPYTEYDIERSDEHARMFYTLGGRGTPLLIVNKEIIYGFDENLVRDAL